VRGQHLDQVASRQRIGHQRQPRNRQALSGQCGLHDLVGVVEVQPARRLQLVAALHAEPALPAQPFQLGHAVGVAGLDQRVARGIGRRPERRAAGQQARAGHHGQLLAEQALRLGPAVARAAVAQGQVHIGGVQVHHGVAGVDADVDIGPGALEGLQARDQPHGGKAGPGGDGHALAAHGLADLAHRGVDLLQRGRHRAQQLGAGPGQLHGARVAQEQRHADFILQ